MRKRWKKVDHSPEEIDKSLKFHQKRLKELQSDIARADKYSSDYNRLKDLLCYQRGMVEILKMGYLYPGELPDDLYREYFPHVKEEPIVLPNYVCINLKSTETSPQTCDIIEIGAVRVRNGEITDTFSSLVRCPVLMSQRISAFTGISFAENIQSPTFYEILPLFLKFIGNDTLVGHDIKKSFIPILNRFCSSIGVVITNSLYDTIETSKEFLPLLPSHKLPALCDFYDIENPSANRALSDAKSTHLIFQNLIYGEFGDPSRIVKKYKDINDLKFPHAEKNIKDLCEILYQALYSGISCETVGTVLDWFEKHPVLKNRQPYSEIFQKIQFEENGYNNDILFDFFLNFIKENYYSFGGTAIFPVSAR